MKHVGPFSRFLVAATVVALVLAAPLGAVAHEHPDQTDSQCRICKVAGAETAVFEDGPELPAAPDSTGLRIEDAQLAPAAPAAAPGAPRAPPA